MDSHIKCSESKFFFRGPSTKNEFSQQIGDEEYLHPGVEIERNSYRCESALDVRKYSIPIVQNSYSKNVSR